MFQEYIYFFKFFIICFSITFLLLILVKFYNSKIINF